MSQVLRFVSVLCFACLFLPFTGQAVEREVRLSSTIGPIDAGIVPLLVQSYEKETGVKVVFEGAGTGATLEKAKSGNFDLVMVHARKLEDAFIAAGHGIDRRDVMYNDFVILGPKDDPAGIKGMSNATAAFAKIATAQSLFITRGDKSGTHVKEMEVWEAAALAPAGDWYHTFADGSKGNRASTLYANERNAYILMDRATWLTLQDTITLIPLLEGDTILLNYIAVIAVNPEKYSSVNHAGATAFMDWLVSDTARAIISNFGVDTYGQSLFFVQDK